MPIAGEEEVPAYDMPYSEAAANIMSEATSGSRRKQKRSSGDELAAALRDLTEDLAERIEAALTTLSTSFNRLTHDSFMVERDERVYGELLQVQGLTRVEVVWAHLSDWKGQ